MNSAHVNFASTFMSFDHFGDILSVAGFIIATCFFYRLGIKQWAPEGFCLFIYQMIFMSALISLSGVFFAIIILDKEIQQTCLKIGFFSALAGFCSIILGNFFKCGKAPG